MDACYIGSVESCWHMFEFPMHALKPTVYRLPVHLEDQQLVYYNPDDNPNEVLERGANKETQLTAWFKINQSNPNARNTTYQNFPQTWVYNSKTKVWKPRQCGQAISRIYFASPSSGERFCFRLLLTVVPGATSSTTSHTTLSKKLALLSGCWRMITSGYSVLEKLAKCRQVTLIACSLLLFSFITIQLRLGFSGINSNTISVMISCVDLQIFIPTMTLFRMKFTNMVFISLIMSFTIGEHSFQIFQACHRS